MKRLLAVLISALMLCPMTSFAAQSEEAKTAYTDLMTKSQTLTDMNAYYDLDMTMSGSLFETLAVDTLSMRMEMNIKMNHMTEPSQMQYLGFSRMTMPQTDPMEYCVYYGNGYYYMDMMGQKVRYPMALDQMMKEVTSSAAAFETSPDMMKDLSLRTEGTNKILSYTIDDAKMNEYMNSVLEAAGMQDLMNGMSLTVRNSSGEYIINSDGYYTKAKVKMDMDMSMNGETVSIRIAGDVGIADPGQPVTFTAPNPKEYTEQNFN